MFASLVGDLASAKLLVAAGANVNDADAWGVSATAMAAHSKYEDLVEFLLDKGANASADEAGFAAIHPAIMPAAKLTYSMAMAQRAIAALVLVVSVALMLPALWQADRPRRGKPVFVGAVAVLFVGQAMLAFAGSSLALTIAALVVFFTAFNLLEAVLPSLVSKFAPPEIKGTAVGVYSSVQFLGTFVGAAGGGLLSQWHGAAAVFGFCLVLTALWLGVSASMAAPPVYNERTYSMGET